MIDELPVQLVVDFLLVLLVLLQVLDDLLIVAVLLLQAGHEPRVYSGLLHLPLEENSQPLGLLDIKRKLGFKLLYLGELHGLLEVKQLLLLGVIKFLDLFHLQLQGCDLAIFLGQRGRGLGYFGCLGAGALPLRGLVACQHVADLSPLERFQEIFIAFLCCLWVKNLLHYLLENLVFLLDEPLLAQELGP